jgi:class 3 adenylate cyclase
VHLTSEFRYFVGGAPGEELGYGEHAALARQRRQWALTLTDESRLEWYRVNLPRMAPATPGGLEGLLAALPDHLTERLGPFGPPVRETLWAGEIRFRQPGLPDARSRYLTAALAAPDGLLEGWVTIWGGGMPASLLSVVARGNIRMFQRMSELVDPGRHETAILFADIQASSQVARRLSSARFFQLIRAFSTDVDEIVVERGGIVGRHAGDGVTAFFLADQIGSRGEACAAALHAARDVVGWRPDLFLDDPDELRINAGVHWGGALYLGQVVTGGRLEITALGDEVNEGARIQQSARDGELLASKAVVERLEPDDARALGIDPVTVRYRTVGELPGVDAKAVRDAGGVSVVSIPSRPG